MKIGIQLPQVGPQASPENLIRVAEKAEQLGYDSVWVLERLLWPINPQDPYPATPDGSLPLSFQNVLDPIETLTFVAAHTKRVLLGTSVMVISYHTPILLARRLATLDVLSGGRAVVGIGVGWSRDEFDAAGTPFANRGARADEFLQAMIDIWTKEPVGFEGRFYRIPESKVGPKPVQKPHPPIYVAGYGQYALDRAVRFGKGWHPSGVPSLEWLAGMIQQLHATSERAGRERLEVNLRASPVIHEEAGAGPRQPLMGTPAEIREDVARLREIGVTELLLTPPEIGFTPASDVEAGLRRMEQLIEICR